VVDVDGGGAQSGQHTFPQQLFTHVKPLGQPSLTSHAETVLQNTSAPAHTQPVEVAFTQLWQLPLQKIGSLQAWPMSQLPPGSVVVVVVVVAVQISQHFLVSQQLVMQAKPVGQLSLTPQSSWASQFELGPTHSQPLPLPFT